MTEPVFPEDSSQPPSPDEQQNSLPDDSQDNSRNSPNSGSLSTGSSNSTESRQDEQSSPGESEILSRQEISQWLSEEDFSDSRTNTESSQTPLRPPGPGLPESIAWMIGVFVLQTITVMVFAVGIILFDSITGGQMDIQDLLTGRYAVVLLGGVQLIFLLGTVLAVFLRFGKSIRRQIPMSPISLGHSLLLFAILFPISMFCSQLHFWTMMAWDSIVSEIPFLRFLDELHAHEMITNVANHISFPAMLLMFAVVPAVAEELIFRGVIGRGLMARWGMTTGIVMTSLLFAVMHIHPAHVAALLPLAIVLHLLYVATRSFWVPMAIHFGNNFLSVLFVKVAMDHPAIALLNANTAPPLPLFFVTGVCVLVLSCVIWKTRKQYQLPDETLWTPGYPTLETPHASVNALVIRRDWDLRLVSAAVISTVVFMTVFIFSALTM